MEAGKIIIPPWFSMETVIGVSMARYTVGEAA